MTGWLAATVTLVGKALADGRWKTARSSAGSCPTEPWKPLGPRSAANGGDQRRRRGRRARSRFACGEVIWAGE